MLLPKYLKEVESRLLTLSPTSNPSKWEAKNYIGAGISHLEFLNIKIPRVRAAYKSGFSFSKLQAKEQWQIWDYIWHHSQIFEVMLFSSYWAATRPVEEMFEQRRLLVNWLKRVDNWAHSDELSSHFAKLLEHDPNILMPVFKKWNASENPWFKRQSMVGLLYYSRSRKRKPPAQVLLKLIARHIHDDHYYVQKGVGWALRETWNVYPRETFAFLRKHAANIPSAGWTAATEKLSAREKQTLMAIRKAKKR